MRIPVQLRAACLTERHASVSYHLDFEHLSLTLDSIAYASHQMLGLLVMWGPRATSGTSGLNAV